MNKLDNSKILLTNFSDPSVKITLTNQTQPDSKLLGLTGFELNLNPQQKEAEICDIILNSILVHDKVVIEGVNLSELVKIFGLDDVILLLKDECLELLNTIGLRPFLIKEGFTYRPIFYRNVTSNNEIIDSLGIAEKYLSSILVPKNKGKLDLLFVLAEKRQIQIDLATSEQIEKTILEELSFDLRNSNLTSNQNIITNDKNLIQETDKYKILRILTLNKALLLSQYSSTKNIKLEGGIYNYLNHKISPILNQTQAFDKSFSLFKKILSDKKVPDVGELYRNKVLSITEILKMRNNLDGKVFRIWYNSTDYNERDVYNVLLQKNRSLKDKIAWKALGWIVPAAVGIASPALGVALSFSGSLYENLITKWQPSLFLDDKLQSFIDEKISSHDRGIKDLELKNRFPKTNRNDPCPCGSKRKFKYCCGKI
jgi:hypothetical protein